jgi:hypothetical protein
MEDDLSKIDPLFAAPPGQTAPPSEEQAGNPLADIDPIFSNPIGPSADASKSSTSPPPPRDNTPEVAGGAVGTAVGLFAPKYENPKLTSARADYAGSRAAEGQLRGELTRMQGDRLDAVDNARFAIQDADASVNMARQELNAAEEAARQLNALPESSPISSADNVVKGASDVEGALSQGALKHSEKMGEVREANQVRKGIAGYKQGLPTSERVPLTGYTQSSRLIVPNELANAPVKSAAQIEAENRLKEAKDKHAAAVKQAAEAKMKQESAGKPSRTESGLSSDVTKASSTTAGKKAALEELEKARSFLSKIPGFNTLMGGLSGAELVHAYRQIRAGNTLDGVMAGLSGAGGLIAMAPNPVAKAIGTAMAVPPLAYQAYQAYKGDNAGVPTQTDPMGN